jgi:hypothetical protein
MATTNPNNPPQAQEPVLQGSGFSFSWYSWFAQIVGRKLQTASSAAPANSASDGTPGQIAYDANYQYVCISANVWKRTPLNTF